MIVYGIYPVEKLTDSLKRMKLRAGKTYRTRHGRKALVAAIDHSACSGHECVGWMGGVACSWNTAGFYFADLSASDLDLVAEWDTFEAKENLDRR